MKAWVELFAMVLGKGTSYSPFWNEHPVLVFIKGPSNGQEFCTFSL